MISSAVLTQRMGSIDDLLHSLLIRPESKRVGSAGDRRGKVRETGKKAEDHSERTEGLVGNKGD